MRLLALLLLLVAAPAAAQLPASGIDRPVRPPEAPVAAPGPTITVELPAGARPIPAIADEPVRVERLTVEGGSALPAEEIDAATRGLVGADTTLGAIYAAAQAITQAYHARGYLLSFAFVPEQVSEDGGFRIQIVEGRLEDVVVSGGDQRLREAVAERLAGLAGPGPARLPLVERALLLLQDMEGFDVSATIQPATGGGDAYDLLVKLERRWIAGRILVDNRGSKYSGRWRGYVEAATGSAALLGDALVVRALGTATLREQRYGAVELTLPLGVDGLRLQLQASRTLSRAGYDLNQFDARGDIVSGEGALVYPLLRTYADSVWISGGFRIVNGETRLLGERLYRDRARAAFAAVRWEGDGPFDGRTRFDLRADQYLRAFAATEQARRPTSRDNTNNKALRLLAEIQHFQPIDDEIELVVQLAGQSSNEPLYSLDDFAPGGGRFGRAYDAGEIYGERGLGGSLELRHAIDGALPDGMRGHVYGFWDGAAIWDKRREERAQQTLSSAGGGLRLDWGLGVSGGLEYAEPLTRPVGAESGAKFGRVTGYVSIQF